MEGFEIIKEVLTYLGAGSTVSALGYGVYYILYGKKKVTNEKSKLDSNTFDNYEDVRERAIDALNKATNKIILLEESIMAISAANHVTKIDLLELIIKVEHHFTHCENPEKDLEELIEGLKEKYHD